MSDRIARLFIELVVKGKSTLYRVTALDPHPNVATTAWRMCGNNGKKKCYDVAINDKGWITCTCADATYRGRTCKHAAALVALGMLPKVTK